MRSAHRGPGVHANSLRLRRRHVLVAGALLVVSVGALLGSAPAIAATAPRALAPSYLFSIPTASGTLSAATGRRLTLRLTGARDYLTRFTDRPLRDASVIANVDFARRFTTYFAHSAPNAVLTYTPPGARIPVSIVLTIGHPRWNAHHHTWTFSATRIRRQPDDVPGTTIHINPPAIPNPDIFTSATLLIDGSSTTVGNPTELSGDGIANSLSGFLATIPGVPGNDLSMTVDVQYSYPLTSPDGPSTSTALVPVELVPNLILDLRVAPTSPLCTVEQGVIQWQKANPPQPRLDALGAYVFNVTLIGAGDRPFYTGTLNYPSASNQTGAIVSAACSGSP